MPGQVFNHIKRHPWVSSTLIVIALILFALPPAVKYGSVYWLEKLTGQPASIESLDLNLFTGRLKIANVDFENQQQSIHIDAFEGKINLFALFSGQLYFSNLSLTNANIPIRIQSTADAQTLEIAGFNLPINSETTETESPKPLSLQFGIEQLQLNQVALMLDKDNVLYHYQINQLNLMHLYSWQSDFARLRLNSRLNQHLINANLQLHLFTPMPKVVGTLDIEALDLQELQTLAPDLMQKLHGQLDLQMTFTLEQTTTGLAFYQYSEAKLQQLDASLKGLQITNAESRWKGNAYAFMGETQALKFNGTLVSNQFGIKTAAEQGNDALQLKTSLDTELNLTAQLNPEELKFHQTGRLQFKNSELVMAEMKAMANDIGFKGDLIWDNPNQKLNVNGTLAAKSANYQDAKNQLSSDLKASLNLQLTQQTERLQILNNGDLELQNFAFSADNLSQQTQQLQWRGKLQMVQTPFKQATPDNSTDKRIELQTENTLVAKQLKSILLLKDGDESSKLTIANNLKGTFTLNAQFAAKQSQIDYRGDTSLSDIKVEDNQRLLSLEQITLSGQADLTQTADKDVDNRLHHRAQLQIHADEFALIPKHLPNPSAGNERPAAVKVKTLEIPELNLQNQSIKLADLAINGIDLQDLTSQSAEQITAKQIAAIQRIQLDRASFNLDTNAIALGKLRVTDSTAKLHFDDNYALRETTTILQTLGLEGNETDPQKVAQRVEQTAPENIPTAGKKSQIALESIELAGNQNIIDIHLQQNEQTIHQTVKVESLKIGALNSDFVADKTPYEGKFSMGEFGSITTQGNFSPFKQPLYVQTNTAIDSLSLLPFSPIASQTIGYQINSGQLSAKIQGTIDNNLIDMQNQLNLYKFNLQKADNQKSADFDKNFQVPLEVGLGLLQDKQGNIQLKLPIKGDLSNPQFNPSNVINTALSGALGKATRTYLLLALQPFGAIALAGEFALDKLSTIRFEPIEFSAGQSAISPKMQEYLGKVAKLLSDKSKIQIQLCGGASEQDRSFLVAETQKTQSKEQNLRSASNPSGAKQPVEIADKRLLELAQNRQTQIKRVLLDQGAKSQQVILCSPAIAPSDTPPKVEMGI